MSNNKRLGNDPFADNSGGLDALISPTVPAARQTPAVQPTAAPRASKVAETAETKPAAREITSTSQKGLPEGWARATYIVRESHIDGLKQKAYMDRRPLKDLVDEAFAEYLANHKEVK